MVIFSNESCSNRQYLCIPTKMRRDKSAGSQAYNSLLKVQMSHRSTKPPFLVNRKYEEKESVFTIKLSVPSCQLLHHDIYAKKKSQEKHPFQGEFSFTPFYWEWLEDVLSHYRDLLVANHLFDALYPSFFVYDKCSNLV